MLRRGEEGAPTWGKNKRTYVGDRHMPATVGRRGFTYRRISHTREQEDGGQVSLCCRRTYKYR